MRKIDLEDRLINFATMVIDIVDSLPQVRASIHLGNQLLRSGTSPALNYAEALSGESRKDFIHKLKIGLKELRESLTCMKILYKARKFEDGDKLNQLIVECNELISIFVKSVQTAEANFIARK